MLNIFTLVLDGRPFIEWHLPVLEQLSIPWRWVICEGTAAAVKDTSWCKPITPRLSGDGTTEYLNSIREHPNVTVLRRVCWQGGKVSMVNAALEQLREPGVLLQVDSDEIYTTGQLEKIAQLFDEKPGICALQFFCRYWLGQHIIVTSENGYGNRGGAGGIGEWTRAWRWTGEQRFQTHEPPVLAPVHGELMTREETRQHGLVFDHCAYMTEAQVKFKTDYYGYNGAVEAWQRLQRAPLPARIGDYLPWVKDDSVCDQGSASQLKVIQRISLTIKSDTKAVDKHCAGH